MLEGDQHGRCNARQAAGDGPRSAPSVTSTDLEHRDGMLRCHRIKLSLMLRQHFRLCGHYVGLGQPFREQRTEQASSRYR